MLRYYWRPEIEVMEAKMASASVDYMYEYLGAGGVLVITPLTDRCYLCLMGALQLDLGGAPAGYVHKFLTLIDNLLYSL